MEFDLSRENLLILQFNFAVDSVGVIQQIGIIPWSGMKGKGPIYDDPDYRQLMSQYALEQVLSRLGQPAEVYIYYEPDPQISTFYDLLLFYPGQGTFFKYRGQDKRLGGQVLLCPLGKSIVNLWTWPPQDGMTASSAYKLQPTIKSQGLETDLDPEKEVYLPLQEATGTDVGAFYEMFSQPGSEDPCLQTPVQMWVDKFKP